MRLEDHIQDIPDFPKPGIVFKDITPLFLDAEALRHAVDALAEYARAREVDYVVSAEARGFVLGGAVAAAAGAGFILARKPGKLPREVASVEYELEYGVDALEVHATRCAAGARVLVHDDLLATGGTAGGAVRPGGAGGRRRGRLRVRDRAGLPPRPRAAQRARRAQPRGRTTRSDGGPRANAWHRRRARGGLAACVSEPGPPAGWWPACARRGRDAARRWTTVLDSPKGKAVRADYTLRRGREPRARWRWRQEVEESPFERISARVGHRDRARARGERRHARRAHARPAPARLGPLQPVPAPRGGRGGRSRARSTASAELARGARPDALVGLGRGRARRRAARRRRGAAARGAGRGPGAPGGRRWRSRRCGSPDPPLPARARERAGGGRWAPSGLRDDREARVAHAVGPQLPGPGAAALGRRARARPTPWWRPAPPSRCAAVLAACARERRGRGAVRRRHERGGRRGAAARGHSPPWSRSTCAGSTAIVDVDRISLTATPRAGPVRARGRGAARRAGAHARPLPAVVRVLDRRAAGWPRARPARRPPATGGSTSWWRACGCMTPGGRARHARRAGHPPPGPTLRELVVGSEGVLGVITEATLRVRPAPEQRRYEGWSFRSFAEGCEAFRVMEQAGRVAGRRRLSDEEETRLSMALASSGSRAERLGSAYLRAARPRGRLHRDRRASRARPTTWSARRGARPALLRAGGGAGAGRAARAGLAARPLSRPLPARRAARPRRDGGDARDRHHAGATWSASTTRWAARCASARRRAARRRS